ncbi:MAG: hypothetical protein AAF223_21805, partial [Bacteroidota bacterium]
KVAKASFSISSAIIIKGLPARATCSISYDKKKDIGGEQLEYRAVLLQKDPQLLMRNATDKELQEQGLEDIRNPNHRKHYTRNINVVTSDGFRTTIIRKIHIPLLVEFNNQTVTP